ncbi:MAG TPA: cation transporter, partial [Methanocella sp.]|nr:cation transporter [Methanocella sp.]
MGELNACRGSCNCHNIRDRPRGRRHDRLQVKGLDCADCAASLIKAIESAPGVSRATLNFNAGTITIEHETDLQEILKVIENSGYQASRDGTQLHIFQIEGLDCADCAAKLEKYISEMPGVSLATLNFSTAQLDVEHTIPVREIEKAISGMGYTYRLKGNGSRNEGFLGKYRRILSTAVSGAGLATGMIVGWVGLPPYISMLFYAFAIVTGGFYIFRSALYSLRSITPDMNLLMTLAVAGAV